MYEGQWWSRSWTGLALILVGLVYLAQNYFGVGLQNWWALFILFPALGSLLSAWRLWRTAGNRSAMTSSLTMGLIFTTVAATFLLDLKLDRVWPVFVIALGVGMLLPGLLERSPKT